MADLLSYGAGASEGLDELFAQQLMHEQMAQRNAALAESQRHNMAGEQSIEAERQSLEGYRKQQLSGLQKAAEEEQARQANEDALIKDPNTPGVLRNFLATRRAVPKGENVPYQLFTEPGGNVRSQKKTGVISDPQIAAQLGVKPGEPVDYDYNPVTLKSSLKGVDITNALGHFQQPDKTLVPTGTGYSTRDDVRRRLAAGQQVPLATTGSTRTRMETAGMTLDKIPYVEGLAESLDRIGLFGPVMSRLRDLSAKAGSSEELAQLAGNDPDLQADSLTGEFATALPLLTSGIAISHYGGNAGRSAQTIQMFKDMFSSAGTLEQFKARLRGADHFIASYAAGPKAAQPQQPQQGTQAPQSGGIPNVGDMFNGGRVLSVTPVK